MGGPCPVALLGSSVAVNSSSDGPGACKYFGHEVLPTLVIQEVVNVDGVIVAVVVLDLVRSVVIDSSDGIGTVKLFRKLIA